MTAATPVPREHISNAMLLKNIRASVSANGEFTLHTTTNSNTIFVVYWMGLDNAGSVGLTVIFKSGSTEIGKALISSSASAKNNQPSSLWTEGDGEPVLVGAAAGDNLLVNLDTGGLATTFYGTFLLGEVPARGIA